MVNPAFSGTLPTELLGIRKRLYQINKITEIVKEII
jgi:hypothetical protein